MKGVLTFRIFVGIPSYPWEFLNFSDLVIFFYLFGCCIFYFHVWTGELKVFIKTMYRIVMI